MILCCQLRAKIQLTPQALSEEVCGVKDSEMADVMMFEKSPNGLPMIAFNFCPWCGKKWALTGRIIEGGQTHVGPSAA